MGHFTIGTFVLAVSALALACGGEDSNDSVVTTASVDDTAAGTSAVDDGSVSTSGSGQSPGSAADETSTGDTGLLEEGDGSTESGSVPIDPVCVSYCGTVVGCWLSTNTACFEGCQLDINVAMAFGCTDAMRNLLLCGQGLECAALEEFLDELQQQPPPATTTSCSEEYAALATCG